MIYKICALRGITCTWWAVALSTAISDLVNFSDTSSVSVVSHHSNILRIHCGLKPTKCEGIGTQGFCNNHIFLIQQMFCNVLLGKTCLSVSVYSLLSAYTVGKLS